MDSEGFLKELGFDWSPEIMSRKTYLALKDELKSIQHVLDRCRLTPEERVRYEERRVYVLDALARSPQQVRGWFGR
jgi:hypothetical protein